MRFEGGYETQLKVIQSNSWICSYLTVKLNDSTLTICVDRVPLPPLPFFWH